MTQAERLRSRWDLLVLDDFARPVLGVEVKGRRDADVEYAKTWRSYFGPSERDGATLLVTTNRMFFWPPRASLAETPREASTLPIYGGRLDPSATRLDSVSLQVIVGEWLERISNGEASGVPEFAGDLEPLVRGRRIRPEP